MNFKLRALKEQEELIKKEEQQTQVGKDVDLPHNQHIDSENTLDDDNN